jgi:hypothetical protein
MKGGVIVRSFMESLSRKSPTPTTQNWPVASLAWSRLVMSSLAENLNLVSAPLASGVSCYDAYLLDSASLEMLVCASHNCCQLGSMILCATKDF